MNLISLLFLSVLLLKTVCFIKTDRFGKPILGTKKFDGKINGEYVTGTLIL